MGTLKTRAANKYLACLTNFHNLWPDLTTNNYSVRPWQQHTSCLYALRPKLYCLPTERENKILNAGMETNFVL